MAESYCLKSCAECGREGCVGCRTGAFAGQCEILKCCKEKNHESCESCTKVTFCATRANRDQMPEKVFAVQRREAELAAKYRADAVILAKWTRVIFWCVIAMNVFSVFGLLSGLVPAFHWVDVLGSAALALGVSYGMLQMKAADERFKTVAILEFGIYAASMVSQELLGEGNGFLKFLQLIIGTVGIYVTKVKTETFRDALCGISREMAGKWERQWDIYKMSLYIILGGLGASLILGILGLIAVVAGAFLLVFVDIREYVYLYQTQRTCLEFDGEDYHGTK